MSIFGRARVTKMSGARPEGVVSAVQGVAMPELADADVITNLEQTDEMPIVREIGPAAYPVIAPGNGPGTGPGGSPARPHDIEDVESRTRQSVVEDDGESDVYVVRRSSPDFGSAPDAVDAEIVTLFVYGWENVEPGPLSWAFPSLRAALDAVRAMRNAVEWCIVAGNEWASIDAARAKGAVLVEQNA